MEHHSRISIKLWIKLIVFVQGMVWMDSVSKKKNCRGSSWKNIIMFVNAVFFDSIHDTPHNILPWSAPSVFSLTRYAVCSLIQFLFSCFFSRVFFSCYLHVSIPGIEYNSKMFFEFVCHKKMFFRKTKVSLENEESF